MSFKLRVLFDATILAEGLRKTSNRSGIFWAAFGIFSALDQRKDIALGVYASPTVVDGVNAFLDLEFPHRSYRVLNRSRSCFLGPIRRYIEDLRERPANKRGIRKKFLVLCGMLTKIACVLWDKYVGCYSTASLADRFEVFFSPVYLAPYAIRKYSHIRRFTLLYDTIPMLFPQFSPFTLLGFSWTFDLIKRLNKDDYGLAISACTRKDYLRFNKRLLPEHVTVLPLAADGKFYHESDETRLARIRRKYGIPEGRRYILSLCTIEPRKNIARSLAAFCKAVKDRGDQETVFVVAGAQWGRYEAKWEEILAGTGEFRNRIFAIGYVDDIDLAPIYSGADLFLYPSLYEGFGLPPLEAMQCGTPVITSNTSSLPEVVGDAGIMVDPTSVDAIAGAISQMLDDPDLRHELSEKGLLRAASFSWRKTAEIASRRFIEAFLEME